jgi:sensor c-di-GMP phosphodiesterase-like protein
MARLVGFVVSPARQAAIAVLLGWFCFVGLVWLLAEAGTALARRSMEEAARVRLEEVVRLRTNAVAALDDLRATVTAVPCSDAFQDQMREVAYRPDGLNEFLYAPGGVARCSTSVRWFQKPVALGAPDIAALDPLGVAVWTVRPLDFIGLRRLGGSIVASGDFAAVIPPPRVDFALPDWMTAEVVLVAPDGRWWHRGGTPGIFEAEGAGFSIYEPVIRNLVCDELRLDCVAVQGDADRLLVTYAGESTAAVVAAGLIAFLTARAGREGLRRYWSFEARFRRHLDTESVVCAYQPILRLSDDRIVGCEVLARWRDLDGTTVPPATFIPLVQKAGLTRAFTDCVVRRAFADLSRLPPCEEPLQVNVNIFPTDLDAAALTRVFAPFLSEPDRYRVVLEIVETDGLNLAAAGAEIEKLRAAGIDVYIDDFGTGYFSVENLVALSVSGVKLDRCFAMAPDNSVMSRMLDIAVEMVAATGRPVVVEGVETAERLHQLRMARHPVHYAQGYFIARPLALEGLAAAVSRTGLLQARAA